MHIPDSDTRHYLESMKKRLEAIKERFMFDIGLRNITYEIISKIEGEIKEDIEFIENLKHQRLASEFLLSPDALIFNLKSIMQNLYIIRDTLMMSMEKPTTKRREKVYRLYRDNVLFLEDACNQFKV